ncbi:sigma-70 family RNA polymerase sigma factor [Nonomuraea sp. NPDC049625]|uniref:sigma-70 family RNA polymerase sigma factor n=1 Tax=Nonomuraea sp. NPDC049625 TaxID=3155775 RepID=UPI00343FF6B3
MSTTTAAYGPDHSSSLDQAAATFVEVRPRLFGIAYRMLAGSAEAEDIVQETWLRWQNTERSAVANPAAFLTLITTRLSINAVQSARSRRETYVGPWLPEPIDTGADPAAGAERGEALELALLLLLEKLTSAQRAAYILREAFVYPYEQIAEVIQLSPANVRQLVSRARKHLSTTRRGSIGTDEHRRLLSAFLDASQEGNLTALENLFAADVVSSPDVRGAAAKSAGHPIARRTSRTRRRSRMRASYVAPTTTSSTPPTAIGTQRGTARNISDTYGASSRTTTPASTTPPITVGACSRDRAPANSTASASTPSASDRRHSVSE